ncbi:MAG: hypothetical protein OCU22_06485 [Canidatus Methanoxibalbensis ujae]|nr:hypothetical protein [Candidatus Methanoxibalbensis ujae]
MSGEGNVSFDQSKVNVGLHSTKTVNITLDKAPNGLSGYNITISLSNPSVAEIVSVSFPSWATLHINSTLPADSVWIKAADLNNQITSGATNINLATITLRGDNRGTADILITVTKMDDDRGNPIEPSTIPGHLEVDKIGYFDTGLGSYPSISGTHTGKIIPSQNITVHKICTYPCPGTGGHIESINNKDGELIASGTWSGYQGDHLNITITPSVTLLKGNEYTYIIKTGSYPQIIHESSKEVAGGKITCTSFIDANGNTYNDWIPAFRIE